MIIQDTKLLLHMCCGPCAEFPLAALREEGFEVEGYYYNPNIHPYEEWALRLDNVRKMAAIRDLVVYENSSFSEDVWRNFSNDKKSVHCMYCYALRMMETARFAVEKGFTSFTTSLLVSPWQNREAIIAAGQRAAERYGITFLDKDFRPGYKQGQDMAREDGLYRQKYCACIYSLRETNYMTKIIKRQGLQPAELPSRRSDL